MKKEQIIKIANKTLSDIKKASAMISAKNDQAKIDLLSTKIQFEVFYDTETRICAAGYYANDRIIHMNTEMFSEANSKDCEYLIEAMIKTIVHEAGHIIYLDDYCDLKTGRGHSQAWFAKTNELTAAMKLLDKKYRFLPKPSATIDESDIYEASLLKAVNNNLKKLLKF